MSFRFSKKVLLILSVLVFLCSCVTQVQVEPKVVDEAGAKWKSEVRGYQAIRSRSGAEHVQDILAITAEMRENVRIMFDFLPPDEAAETLANWLMAEDGHNMTYDVEANFSPIGAYTNKQGNCLSFTLLLVSLAEELGARIKFNAVDIPSTWGMDEELGMVFYRHVNGILESAGQKRIFDLAMYQYNLGFPQRTISAAQAVALLHNNYAIDALREGNLVQALHQSKMAISLSPENADLWVNLGVIMKHKNNPDNAEIAFLEAASLDKYNLAAASNLERFYLAKGDLARAQVYSKQAELARQTNPYHHYQAALQAYEEKRYRFANKATEKAIFLHSKDPRFFELKSLIAQQRHRYKDAILALTKAYEISTDQGQRVKYFEKAKSVADHAIAEAARRQSNREAEGYEGPRPYLRR